MKTIEQKAEEAWIDYVYPAGNLYENVFKDAYIAGAKEALAGQWRDLKEELPEDEEYVLICGPMGIEPAVWNEHYECWDDADGDDNMYKKDAVKLWMPIPEPPKTEER